MCSRAQSFFFSVLFCVDPTGRSCLDPSVCDSACAACCCHMTCPITSKPHTRTHAHGLRALAIVPPLVPLSRQSTCSTCGRPACGQRVQPTCRWPIITVEKRLLCRWRNEAITMTTVSAAGGWWYRELRTMLRNWANETMTPFDQPATRMFTCINHLLNCHRTQGNADPEFPTPISDSTVTYLKSSKDAWKRHGNNFLTILWLYDYRQRVQIRMYIFYFNCPHLYVAISVRSFCLTCSSPAVGLPELHYHPNWLLSVCFASTTTLSDATRTFFHKLEIRPIGIIYRTVLFTVYRTVLLHCDVSAV